MDTTNPPLKYEGYVGSSGPSQLVLKMVERIIHTVTTVLLRGETGTGKDLVAKMIHHLSPRNKRPFVHFSCAGVQEGLLESELFGHEKGAFTGAVSQRKGCFEMANGGTMYLDEVSNMSRPMQTKLLRVLQEREIQRLGSNETIKVDVRIIASTKEDLMSLVDKNEFREDLYYRLNVMPIDLPTLRARGEGDIMELAHHFLKKASREYDKQVSGFDNSAVGHLLSHSWPGNIRELQNMIERMVICTFNETITKKDLQVGQKTSYASGNYARCVTLPPTGVPLWEIERQALVQALEMTNFVQKSAAELLGISPRVMNYKIQTFGILLPGNTTAA